MKEKLRFSAGVLNCVQGAVMAINTLFMLLFLLVVIVMPVLLPIFFLPMVVIIPVTGFVFCISAGVTVCNLVAGVGTVLSSIRGGAVSKVFTVISTVVDGVFIPAIIGFLYVGVVSNLGGEISWLSVSMLAVSVAATGLTVAGLILNIICLVRMNRASAVQTGGGNVTDV